MDCPVCKKAVPDEAKFCSDCGAPLGAAGPVVQSPAPVVASAPQAEAPRGFGALSLPAQLAIGCGIPIAGVLLIVAIGFVVYQMQRRSHTGASQQAATTLDEAVGEARGGKGSPEKATEAADRLAGQWTVVYFSGEGDPPPSGLSLREEGGEIVGELQGRYETKVRLTEASDGKWTGTYADANRPSGTHISAEMPGRDRLRITDEDAPRGPEVLLVVDRPGGSDLGPHPRAETKDEALEAVSADPKVADWLKEIDAARASGRKTSAHVDIEEEYSGWYIAHVYELVDDGGGQGHTATFGRYYVYRRSGVVMRLESE